MKTAHGASMNSERSNFLGTLTAASALVLVMATGCAAPGDESGQASSSHPDTAEATQGGSTAQVGASALHGSSEWTAEGLTGGVVVESHTVTPSPYGAGATPAVAPPPFKTTAAITCNPIVEGSNSVKVNGKTRKFDVHLPNDTTSKAALLFEWSGFLQNSTDFSNAIVYDPPAGEWKPFDTNAFNMPLITIAPHSENIIPIWGLDWDIVSGEKDFPYFEAILTCLESQFNVDTRRVYSFGFSAGAVFTDLLSAAYPKMFAATISESGVWFNDRPEWSEIIIPGTGTLFMRWKWPALDPADRGAVFMTHGGPNDFATVISLENANNKAVPFLYNAGRDVTECTHEFGHTLEPDITQGMYYQYMWDHELGAPRQAALSASLPTPSAPVYNTKCMYHPGL
jgi:predicted esterase